MSGLIPTWRFHLHTRGMSEAVDICVEAESEREAQAGVIAELHRRGWVHAAVDYPSFFAGVPDATLERLNGKGLPLIDVAAWVGEPPALRSLWGAWLPVHQTTMLTGLGGVGKSLFEQALCTAVAVGLPFLGLPTEQRNTLYITCEDDEDELFRRQAAIERALGITRRDWLGRLWLTTLAEAGETALAAKGESGRIEPTDRWSQIEDTCRAQSIGLFAFDNATDALAGDLNDATQVAAMIGMMTRLAVRQDGVAMILHHPNKAGAEYSNSMAFHNKVRSRLVIDYVDRETDPDARRITNPKLNYGPAGGHIDFRWHEGAFVRADDLPAQMGKELAQAARDRADDALFLQCLALRNKQGRPVSESELSRTFAPAVFERMPEAKGTNRKRLDAAFERLMKAGRIERGVVCRKDRKDREGLIEKCADLCADPALTPRADREGQGALTALSHTPSLTEREGGAFEGPPPSPDGEGGKADA